MVGLLDPFCSRPHHSTTQMRPVVTDRVAWSVCRSACNNQELSKNCWTDRRCRLGCGLGWAQGSIIRWDARWRHLANTTEPSMCGGDVASCQTILTTYCCHCSRRLTDACRPDVSLWTLTHSSVSFTSSTSVKSHCKRSRASYVRSPRGGSTKMRPVGDLYRFRCFLQCSDTVGRLTGRSPGLQK